MDAQQTALTIRGWRKPASAPPIVAAAATVPPTTA